MLGILVNLMFKMLFPVIFAYILYNMGILTETHKKNMTDVLLNCAVPFTIVMSSQQELNTETSRTLLIATVFCIAFYAVLTPVLKALVKKMGMENWKGRVFVCSILFYNCTLVGFPVLNEIYGKLGLLCAVISSMVYNAFFYTWAVRYLGASGKGGWKAIFLNKYALCTIAALLLYSLQITVPEPLNSTFNMLSAMTLPLAMLIAGCNMAASGVKKIVRDRSLYLPAFMRNLIVPAICFAILRLLGVKSDVAGMCTLIAALPTGTMTSIMASESGHEGRYATNIMVFSTLLMAITIPLWTVIVKTF